MFSQLEFRKESIFSISSGGRVHVSPSHGGHVAWGAMMDAMTRCRLRCILRHASTRPCPFKRAFRSSVPNQTWEFAQREKVVERKPLRRARFAFKSPGRGDVDCFNMASGERLLRGRDERPWQTRRTSTPGLLFTTEC